MKIAIIDKLGSLLICINRFYRRVYYATISRKQIYQHIF